MLFRVHRSLQYGTSLFLTGSTTGLSKWSVNDAIPCVWTENDIWTVRVEPKTICSVPPPTRFEFKFFQRSSSSHTEWEPGENHAIVIPSDVTTTLDTMILNVQWGAVTSSSEVILSSSNNNIQLPSPPPTPHQLAHQHVISLAKVAAAVVNYVHHGYLLIFRMKYRAAHGERLYIVGSIPQLGMWNKMHSPMLMPVMINKNKSKQNISHKHQYQQHDEYDHDLYEIRFYVPNDSVHTSFEYKYFTRKADGSRRWEDGENRIAKPGEMNGVFSCYDPENEDDETGIISTSSSKPNTTTATTTTATKTTTTLNGLGNGNSSSNSSNGNGYGYSYGLNSNSNGLGGDGIINDKSINRPKTVIFDDRWEKVCCEFSIYFPGQDPHDIMHITGDIKELGAWYKPGPTRMKLGPEQMLETDVRGRKWVIRVWIESVQALEPFSYRYILINEKTGQEVWEREPNRRTDFSSSQITTINPSASSSSSLSSSSSSSIIINSIRVFKDVNFVSDMKFDIVPPHMFIGPYPQSISDVDTLAKANVTAVLNVQSEDDFKHRGVQWTQIKNQYDKHGIEVVRFPITDFDRDSLRQNLNKGAHQLHDLIQRGKEVYVHCTAGMGRAPAIVVAYLVWVHNMSLSQAVAHVKKYRTVAVPNVPVLEEALKEPF